MAVAEVDYLNGGGGVNLSNAPDVISHGQMVANTPTLLANITQPPKLIVFTSSLPNTANSTLSIVYINGSARFLGHVASNQFEGATAFNITDTAIYMTVDTNYVFDVAVWY